MKCDEKMMRLYAVTDRKWTGRQSLYEQVEAALKGGVTIVQLREKDLSEEDFEREAIEIGKLCKRYDVPLIINDNVDLAIRTGASGVHVGQEDMEARSVRKKIGPDMILGVSAHNVEEAKRAVACGADYLGSGAVFGTATKTNVTPMKRETLRAICDAVEIPVVAIGGVDGDNLPLLKGTGVAGAAIVSAIFSADDIEKECRHLRALSEEMVRGGE
ncbi:MAG: thiamine phosphate synthase [Lachnospiraceae bacterium]|nr:thiamine phosphate synthase [Lachnospiraceae bacterium]